MTESGPESGYRVLARKYRPATFEEIVGQDAMVRTLTNAIKKGRLAHAYILTGVRGVGKTTTARILAKALNCEAADEPTATPCGTCGVCLAIAESRQVDVLEMDAASRTGVGDVREIIENVRYAPTSVRYKVYIIDEVHMLSGPAFNALLKTLEEPPPHIVFVLATTEIRKVPMTVLSRCQRFDLRRLDTGELTGHLGSLAEKEGVEIEPGALALIVRAAEGSVRDGLSLLDQAMAQGDSVVTEDQARTMLGLADRAIVFDLFQALMEGQVKAALENFRGQFDLGADPLTVLRDLAELCHTVTRLKLVPEAAADLGLASGEVERAQGMADGMPIPELTRAWQMLLKGLGEVRGAEMALPAAEMVLIRMAHAAELPTPADLVRRLEGADKSTAPKAGPAAAGAPARPPAAPPAPQSSTSQSLAPQSSTSAAASPAQAVAEEPEPEPEEAAAAPPAPALEEAPELTSFADVARLFEERREGRIYAHLVNDVRPVAFERGRIEINPGPGAPPDLAARVADRLSAWTGERWTVTVTADGGAATLGEQAEQVERQTMAEVEQDELVQAAFRAFPGATVTDVCELGLPGPDGDNDGNGDGGGGNDDNDDKR